MHYLHKILVYLPEALEDINGTTKEEKLSAIIYYAENETKSFYMQAFDFYFPLFPEYFFNNEAVLTFPSGTAPWFIFANMLSAKVSIRVSLYTILSLTF